MSKLLIKRHRNRNNYLLTKSGLWVRDFNQKCSPVDLNRFIDRSEYKFLMENEIDIRSQHIPEIGSEFLPTLSKVLIVSDGYRFNEERDLLHKLPADVCIIGTNRSLAKWHVDSEGIVKRRMDFYFVNNPYQQCMSYLPLHTYRPRCVCSVRTYPKFIKRYKGTCFYYVPTGNKAFGTKMGISHLLDDYRNPICGAICLARRCKVRRLALFCCDDAFRDERPAAVSLPNNLWMYPQHAVTHEVIGGLFHWLKDQEDLDIKIADHSSGPNYDNAPYIEADSLLEFFDEQT